MDKKVPIVLIVEDDEDLLYHIKRLFKRNGFVAIGATTVKSAHEEMDINVFDAFILDIELPDGNGFDLCEEIRSKNDNTPILFLTGMLGMAAKSMDSNADYFISKPFDNDELVAAIRRLVRRTLNENKKLAEAQKISKGPLTLNMQEGKAYLNGRDIALSGKEFNLLALLMQNEGKQLTYDKIYMSIWKSSMNNDPNTLRKTISRLRKKLDEDSSSEFSIVNQHKQGYMFIMSYQHSLN
ncbi:MAG: response regulator transcription factor [Eubacteriaceae bacterium]|nr:response regulator transcription factor [Eubacteriaceae bacterium]